jgi:hypothetical protein
MAMVRLPAPLRSPTIRTLALEGILEKFLGGFMFAIRSSNFKLSLMLVTTLSCALSFLLWPVAARAYTAEEQQACSNDAFRLCSAEIPDVDRITVCMIRNKSQLSPGCRVFFRRDPKSHRPRREGRSTSGRESISA